MGSCELTDTQDDGKGGDTSFPLQAREMGFIEASGDHPRIGPYLLCDGCLRRLGERLQLCLDSEAGMKMYFIRSHYTGVRRLGQVWAMGREPAQNPSQGDPRTDETTRFPGAEEGNPSGQEGIWVAPREPRKAKEGKFQTERT